MKLFKKPKSKYYWYDFTVRGERYRGSTQETKEARAGKIASLKVTAAVRGSDPLDRKAPSLREFSARFLEWVETARLETDTQRYYRNGWRLLKDKPIAGMRMDRITADDAEALRFPGSPANANNALRTLRRMLSKGKECKLLWNVPEFKLFKEHGRSLRLDDDAERKLLLVAEQPLKDIVVLMRDTGMRNGRELYRMRIENIDWNNRMIFNPNSKTMKGRRFIPMSDRVLDLLVGTLRWPTRGLGFPIGSKGKTHRCRPGEQAMGQSSPSRRIARQSCALLCPPRLWNLRFDQDRKSEGSYGRDGSRRRENSDELPAS